MIRIGIKGKEEGRDNIQDKEESKDTIFHY